MQILSARGNSHLALAFSNANSECTWKLALGTCIFKCKFWVQVETRTWAIYIYIYRIRIAYTLIYVFTLHISYMHKVNIYLSMYTAHAGKPSPNVAWQKQSSKYWWFIIVLPTWVSMGTQHPRTKIILGFPKRGVKGTCRQGPVLFLFIYFGPETGVKGTSRETVVENHNVFFGFGGGNMFQKNKMVTHCIKPSACITPFTQGSAQRVFRAHVFSLDSWVHSQILNWN